jgi:hypothetical protein
MAPTVRAGWPAVVLLAVVSAPVIGAAPPNPADDPIRQFLAQGVKEHRYRAVRHLQAEQGSRKGWMEAITEYAPATGFRYEVVAEGGSHDIRTRVLKAVLDGERDVIVAGETARSSITPSNYTFRANGIDSDGLASVLLSPRRKEDGLVSGKMALNVSDGALVRVEGRLAKSPSFWLKNVDIVRTYARIDGKVVPVVLETKAQVRFLGEATLRMTYVYSEIDGRPVAGGELALAATHAAPQRGR